MEVRDQAPQFFPANRTLKRTSDLMNPTAAAKNPDPYPFYGEFVSRRPCRIGVGSMLTAMIST
jgi:hypothetical protein